MKKKTLSTAVVAKAIEKQASPFLKRLSNITSIKNNEQYEEAAVQVKELKKLKALAEEELDGIVKPIQEGIKKLKEHFSPFIKVVDEKEAFYKELMLEFVESEEEKRLALDKQMESGKIKKIATYTAKVLEHTVISSAASIRSTNKVEVVNVKQIPLEYLVPDLKAIEAALKDGKKVPGCKLVSKKSIAI